MSHQPVPINSQPGVQRDGTRLEADFYNDVHWCRFQRGRPKKIFGYQSVTGNIAEITRGMDAFSSDGINYVYTGHQSTLQQHQVNNSGNLVGGADRTPAGFTVQINNLWQFDVMFEAVGATNQLLAHAGENLSDIDSSVQREIYFGDVTAAAILTGTGKSVSGGVVALGPYTFAYGSDGLISFSPVNDPSGAYTDAFVTQQKVVKGLPLRGSGSGPAGIFWSLDSVIRAQFVGGAPVWAFDTISSQSSILSSQGVIEYDGIFYWAGVDRFLMFNGVVRDVPNTFNVNWFFDNLNFNQRQKVFAFKVPRFGEIWWCYPRGNATECTHAVIFKVNEGFWYDTELPDEGRSAGIYAKTYEKPFMTDVEIAPAPGTGYTLWQHETGTDKIQGSNVNAIQSFFETHEISLLEAGQGDQAFSVARVEPDFVQTGDLSLTVRGRANSRAAIVDGETFTFPDSASQPDEETVKIKEVKRLMSFKFESNVQGGNYEMGDTYAHVAPADARIES